MTLKEILETGGGVLLIVLTLVQIAPIKVNPWSVIAAALGRALNKDVIDLIEKGKAETARYRIIRFNDEIRHDVRHTEEHFTQIIEDIDTYENFVPSTRNSTMVKRCARLPISVKFMINVVKNILFWFELQGVRQG